MNPARPKSKADGMELLARGQYNLEARLGNSCVQVDANGALISREEYYPFGETSFGSFAKKRYRYNGKERDEESGLYNYGMRYYAAWTCRFVSVDPLAADYTYYTPYQYAGNKPINFIDLDGLEESNESKDGTEYCPGPTDTKKRWQGFIRPELRIFSSEVKYKTKTKEKNITTTRSWNRIYTTKIRNAGELTVNFYTKHVPDRLVITGPNRNRVDSGMISTWDSTLNDDPGQTFSSSGLNHAYIKIEPSNKEKSNFFKRNFEFSFKINPNNQQTNDTVWKMEIHSESETEKRINKIKLFGVITVYRKVVYKKPVELGEGEHGNIPVTVKLSTFKEARAQLRKRKS